MIKPVKAIAALCAASLAALVLMGPGIAAAQVSGPAETRFTAVVIDAGSGEVLYGRRADSPRYPASISKVMTLYLTFEALDSGRIHLTDQVTVSRHAASMQPTKLGVRAGNTLTVEDAIQAMAIQSANDIAVAMAEHLGGGSESRFATMMTLKARQLGMTQTRFVNASGLPDARQVSTSRDIALLSRAVMRDYPRYYGYFGQNEFTYGNQTMRNHNNLLRSMPGVDGLKTGYTGTSGYNLAASAVQGDHRLITVVLGGTSNPQRDNEVARLLNIGFDVAARRDGGEVFAETQSLFAPREFARVEGADTPADGIEVAEGDVGEGAMRPIANPGAAGGPRGDYVVQVGAFKQRSQAQNQLRTIGRRFASIFEGAEDEVGSRSNGFYRAWFKGLTEDSAKAACATLRSARVSCLVIAP